MAPSSGTGTLIKANEAMHMERLVYFGSGTEVAKSSSYLKAGKNPLFPFTSEGAKPTGQGQTCQYWCRRDRNIFSVSYNTRVLFFSLPHCLKVCMQDGPALLPHLLQKRAGAVVFLSSICFGVMRRSYFLHS